MGLHPIKKLLHSKSEEMVYRIREKHSSDGGLITRIYMELK
jgi:hypothetical protein